MANADQMLFDADPNTTTHLAMFLNAAMAHAAGARAAYAAIYGEEWSPLGCGAELNDGASSRQGTVR